MSQFIGKPAATATVPLILKGVSDKAESLWPMLQSKSQQLHQHHPSRACAGGSITVVHKLDEEIEVKKLQHERLRLYEENQSLKKNQNLKEIFNHTDLENKQLKQEVERLTRLPSITPAAENAPLSQPNSGIPVSLQVGSVCTSQNGTGASTSLTSCLPVVTNQQQLTTEQIRQFNKLPSDLKVFYEQMQTGNFSGTQYSKSGSTKSSYTKRKLVYQFIRDYPGGATKCFQDFDTKSPTWLYENKIRKSRC